MTYIIRINQILTINLAILTLAAVGDWVAEVAFLAATQWSAVLHVTQFLLAAGVGKTGVNTCSDTLHVHLTHLSIAAVIVLVTLRLSVFWSAA